VESENKSYSYSGRCSRKRTRRLGVNLSKQQQEQRQVSKGEGGLKMTEQIAGHENSGHEIARHVENLM